MSAKAIVQADGTVEIVPLTADERADLEKRGSPTAAEVNAERDRRIAAGFEFEGRIFDARPEDQKRINGAASLALTAIAIGGKQPGDFRWHDGIEDFGWIAQDNGVVPMDAPTVIEFGKAAARWESAHVFAARALKNLAEIPADYASNETYWPQRGEV